MRVLIVNQHPSDALGGSEMQCDLIARGLTERGHRVLYCAVGKCREHYEEGPYQIQPLAIEEPGSLGEILSNEKPDVVYWRFNRNCLHKALAETVNACVPLVFAVSHINDLRCLRGHRIVSDLFANLRPRMVLGRLRASVHKTALALSTYRALKHVDAVTVLNSNFLDKVPVKRKRVIWNAVVETKAPFEWPRAFCVWVANIKERKRPDVFTRLAEKLYTRFPCVDFLMIGPMADSRYRSCVAAAERLAHFHYLGYQTPETVNGALARASCLIHTCRPEGFGNNFIQAWMQGCPTISLEFDPDGLITREALGYVSGNEEQLAMDVGRLFQNAGLRDEIGERARRFAREHFRTDRMVNEVESFLTEVISEYHPRRKHR
jgi:glycosyltransferase involved in cell wall biosynthesis